MFFKAFVLSLALLSGLASHAHARDQTPLKMVASFSILADIAQQIGGDAVQVTSLVGPEQDAHTFQPLPDQAKALAHADIIIVNGLKFEEWMDRLITASGTKAKLLVASASVKPRFMEDGHDHHHEADHGQTIVDPHAWQDLRFGYLYAQNIANAIIAARPDLKDQIMARLSAYKKELATLNKQALDAFASLPPEKRKIITSHDAFGYMADAYGLTFIAPVGLSTEAEPTAADVARLIKQIKDEKISILFVENMSDPRLIEQIAKDTGVKMGGKLYTDALSAPDGEAPTYLDMMRHNIKQLSRR